MKKMLLVVGGMILSTTMFSQTNQISNTGNIGIGTTNPTKNLEVNGQTRLSGTVEMDSMVIVKDSMIVEKDARIKENLKVEKNVYVLGTSTMIGDFTSQGTSNLEGTTYLNGQTYLTSVSEAPITQNSIQNGSVLVKGPNGKILKTSLASFSSVLYNPNVACLQDQNGNVINVSPTWHNANPDILYTGLENCENFAKVGINTEAPNANLQVRNVYDTDPENILILDRKSTNYGVSPEELLLIDGNGRTVHSVFPSSNNDFFTIEHATTYEKLFRVNENGHVYISGPAPVGDDNYFVIKNSDNGQKLFQVNKNGLIRAREIKVDLNVWPDYVFDADYKLMTIEELKAYVEKYHHLPGVKKDTEILESGLSLGETNKILMEKMEELSLYIIHLNEKIKNLEKQLKNK